MKTRVPLLATALVGAVFLAGAGALSPSLAGWLARLGGLADEAGGPGGSVLRHGLPGDEFAAAFARHVKTLPAEAGGAAALAAHATPEGHWRFTSRSGEHFTAANPAELERAVATLLPDTPAGARLDFYLSADTLFRRGDLVASLPPNATLHMLTDGRAYRLQRSAAGKGVAFAAEVRPHVRVELGDPRLFAEAVWQLARPLDRAGVRVLSLEPGARQTLPPAPPRVPQTRAATVDQIDPWKLPAALASVRGQTVVLTGRIDGELLHFKPPGGSEKALSLRELTAAARAADVNMVVLQSAKAMQPGARNWLWQTVEVKGLGDALARRNLGDFLDALGAGHGGLRVAVSPAEAGRARLDVVPAEATRPVTDGIGNWADQLVADALGQVLVEAVRLDVVDKERHQELDRRLVPGIPSLLQWSYLAALLLGLVGISYGRRWFARIWPAEERAEYAGAFGYRAARAVRGLAFVLVFLPLVGLPAALLAVLVGTVRQAWSVLAAPLRALGWLFRKLGPARG